MASNPTAQARMSYCLSRRSSTIVQRHRTKKQGAGASAPSRVPTGFSIQSQVRRESPASMISRKYAAVSFICGLFGLLATYSLATSLGAFLEETSRTANGGAPYAAGVFVAGAAASICIFYFGYLFLAGWNSHRALSALQLCTIAAFVAIMIATVAFVVVTGLFNAVGFIESHWPRRALQWCSRQRQRLNKNCKRCNHPSTWTAPGCPRM